MKGEIIHSVIEFELPLERDITLGGDIPFGQRSFLRRNQWNTVGHQCSHRLEEWVCQSQKRKLKAYIPHPLYPESDLRQHKMDSGGQYQLLRSSKCPLDLTTGRSLETRKHTYSGEQKGRIQAEGTEWTEVGKGRWLLTSSYPTNGYLPTWT